MAVDLNKLYHVNINVTNLERSTHFYEALGFKVTARFTMDGDLGRSTCEAFGVPYNKTEAVFMKLKNSPMLIDLCEYQEPPTHGETYRTLNNVGMVRLAFHVDDIRNVHAKLVEMGTTMLGPLRFMKPPGGVESAVFAFRDPDGTILEVLSGVEHMALPSV